MLIKEQALLLRRLKVRGPFYFSEIKDLGLSRKVLIRLLSEGLITQLERGLYEVTQGRGSKVMLYVTACALFGEQSSISGFTALSHYGLVENVSGQVWVMVPHTIRTQRKRYRLLRSRQNLTIGVESYKGYRIVSIERSLIDAMFRRSFMSPEEGVSITQKALSLRKTTFARLSSLAYQVGVGDELGLILNKGN